MLNAQSLHIFKRASLKIQVFKRTKSDKKRGYQGCQVDLSKVKSKVK